VPTYDAVLLDLYDTLVWSDWLAWQHTLAERLGITPQAMGEVFTVTRPARSKGENADENADMAAIVEAAGHAPDPDLVAELIALEGEMMRDRVHLYDDSLDVVRRLRARGVKTALVSNCSYNTVPIVERLGLEAEFDAVILSFAVRSMKPEPEIYRLALEALGHPDPSRAVFVDDQVVYCDGAKAVGLDTYLIFRPEEAMEGRPASTNGHRIIEDLRPLIAETAG
jgi:putative hydrolase of the HAD superfamily